MLALERPQLRPHLGFEREDREGRHFVVWDQLHLSDRRLRVSALELEWLRMFDGQQTLRDVQARAMRALGGHLVPLETFTRLVDRLDEALFLDSPRFRAHADHPVRSPACLGSYEENPARLRRQLESLFTGPGGPGRPGEPRPDPQLRGALVPHIDYGRGGRTYAWIYKEVFERTAASLFVIIGTSHFSRHCFTLTRKSFQTPLGLARTDQGYIDRLVAHYGAGLFDDEWLAHLPEHSIELEVVFLQYLYEGRRPFRIVPLVVGSFQDCIDTGRSPTSCPDVARMVEALRAVERETPEPICYLISGDLAHLGPKFGDLLPVTPSQVADSRTQDDVVLRRAEAGDPVGFFHVIAREEDRRRICGLSPLYVVLEALRPGFGRRLHYDQYVHPRGHESVSFAGVTFYR